MKRYNSQVRGYLWFTPNSWGTSTVHYLVMWGDDPIFYDNTGGKGWQKMLKHCQARVEALGHLEMNGQGKPKKYTAVEAWPPAITGQRRPWPTRPKPEGLKSLGWPPADTKKSDWVLMGVLAS